MYSIGSYVRYGTSGVCLIEDIRKLDYAGKGDFYILKPISNNSSTLYVPVDREDIESIMRKILGKDEIDSLIDKLKSSDLAWIDDRKQRSEAFKQILKRNDQQELMSLVSCIYLKRRELAETGKKLTSADESALQQAESMVENEFAFVLNINPGEVGEYIRKKLGIE